MFDLGALTPLELDQVILYTEFLSSDRMKGILPGEATRCVRTLYDDARLERDHRPLTTETGTERNKM